MTAILGISAFYHDSAAALVVDGEIVAAAQEERFTRKKHDAGFPTHSIEYCLREAGIDAGELDYVGFYDKPWLKFERLLETYVACAPQGFRSFMKAMPQWLRQKLHLPREIRRGLGGGFRKRIVFTEHHESHAASAFFPSPFDEAAILTVDGVGEWATASLGYGRGNRITLTHEMRFPHSLGMLYSAFTYFTGFTVNSGEYKLMGLAPYGEPKYVDLILDSLMDLKPDGSFRLDMSYFNYCQGLTMTNRKFARLFGGPPRKPDSEITQRDMDLAASVQKVTEEIVLRMVRTLQAETGMESLCLAGGVALNCVANGRILREGPFKNVWVQPAAGDAGGALGVAQFIWHQLLNNPRTAAKSDQQRGSLLGPSYGDEEIQEFLDTQDVTYTRADSDEELCETVAGHIASGKVVGWFQGRMEFGPRALGSRSILGDARNAEMQRIINMKVKFREGFRPFAPSILCEKSAEFFEIEPNHESAYMLMVAPVQHAKRNDLGGIGGEGLGLNKLHTQRSVIPAVTHVDYSARVQTIDKERHGLYRQLLDTFNRKTGCPVVINTSFNLGWDPIVATPREAYDTFMSCDLDVLCMGRFVLTKRAQRAWVPATPRNEPTGDMSDLWCSPCCEAELETRDQAVVCTQCSRKFAIEDGIPQLFHPHEAFDKASDVTETVKAFYEKTPFPNYDEHESLRSLIEKSRRGIYAKRLNDAIPFNSTVLEVGCGTGQLSNFLGISCRRVVGADLCMNSLRLGEAFRKSHGLSRVRFLQMNLFRPCLKRERFDVILCNGVLHHTSDPYGGFEKLVPLLRPGGHIVVGLYNQYGRLATDLRRKLFRVTGMRGSWIDPNLRASGATGAKREAWLADQYRHPHESKHTQGEVLNWFGRNGLEFVRAVPSISQPHDNTANGALFSPEHREATTPGGSAWDRGVSQFKQVFSGSREGGFFVMIGRKPDQPSTREVD